MKEEKLRELIDRYYNAETSPEEEKILIKYFSGDEILPGYEAEKEIFSNFSALSQALPSPSDGLEDKILRSADIHHIRTGRRAVMRRLAVPAGIAATILLITAMYFLFTGRNKSDDTFKDPVIAYAETMKILNQVSFKLNKGTRALTNLNQINRAAHISVESFRKPVSLLNNPLKKIKLIDNIQGEVPGNKIK